MLSPLKMISSCQNAGKSTLFAKFGTVLWFCSSFERFWGSLVSKWGKLLLKVQVQGGPGAQICTSGGKLHEVGSHGCSDENGEHKEHKGKKTIQRRRRRKP